MQKRRTKLIYYGNAKGAQPPWAGADRLTDELRGVLRRIMLPAVFLFFCRVAAVREGLRRAPAATPVLASAAGSASKSCWITPVRSATSADLTISTTAAPDLVGFGRIVALRHRASALYQIY